MVLKRREGFYKIIKSTKKLSHGEVKILNELKRVFFIFLSSLSALYFK